MKIISKILLAILLTGAFSSSMEAKENSVKSVDAVITEVIDGDTVKVNTDDGTLSVRFLYIDAMEKSYNDKMRRDIRKFSDQGVIVKKKDLIALGKLAKIYLASILRENEPVVLEIVRGNEKDHYGRTLAVVYKKDLNIGLLMVQTGYARTYFVGYVPETVKKIYLKAEEKARSENLVIWNYLKK